MPRPVLEPGVLSSELLAIVPRITYCNNKLRYLVTLTSLMAFSILQHSAKGWSKVGRWKNTRRIRKSRPRLRQVIYEFFSYFTNTPLGLSAYKP